MAPTSTSAFEHHNPSPDPMNLYTEALFHQTDATYGPEHAPSWSESRQHGSPCNSTAHHPSHCPRSTFHPYYLLRDIKACLIYRHDYSTVNRYNNWCVCARTSSRMGDLITVLTNMDFELPLEDIWKPAHQIEWWDECFGHVHADQTPLPCFYKPTY